GALERLLRRRGLPRAVATVEQVHGSKIVIVPRLKRSRKYSRADGLLTEQTDQPLAIFTADCVPVFLQAGDKVVGLLHAGWRGVRRSILEKAVRKIRRRWGLAPRQITCWVGSSIGPCCFEVRWDVARSFPFSRRRHQRRWRVDLPAEVEAQ